MKLNVFKYAKENTTYLQGFGHVEGAPAGELQVGNTMIWNNGTPSKVIAIVKETEKTIVVLEEYEDRYSPTGFSTYERKLLKSRIVARPVHELNGTEEEPENVPSGSATSRQNNDRPSDVNEYQPEVAGVVLITEGPEVDLVTDLFDRQATNATEVDLEFQEKISKILSETENVEEDFDRLAAAFSPGAGILIAVKPSEDKPAFVYSGPKEEPKSDDVEYYPNQVTFDRVVSLYPDSKITSVEEFFTMNVGWRKPEDVIGKNALSFWRPEELVQFLKDRFDGSSFCLIVEGKDGRRKNPDYKYEELIVGFEPGDRVLYHKDQGGRPFEQEGIVSTIEVENGRSKIWVRYTTGETGALTPLANLSKI